MGKRLIHTIACLLALLLQTFVLPLAAQEEGGPSQYSASNPSPEAQAEVQAEVQGLRYGVILYHFYQQSYFDALTETLIGEQQNDMPLHADAAELLRGGMSLSYGMSNDAEAIFNRLLTTVQKPRTRNRAWFYLGKLHYLRGDRDLAARVLNNIDGKLPGVLRHEALSMRANLALNKGDQAAAETYIEQLPDDSPWQSYYYFNRGSTQTLAGDWQAGVESFRMLEQLSDDSEEALSLRDSAYTAAGFANLGGGDLDAAINDFTKVRLQSPLVDRAMLGYGWASAQQGDYRAALAPWQALSRRSLMIPAVQESLLAIPYAYEKLDAAASALVEYQQAIAVYETEISNITQAVVALKSMPLLDLMSDEAARGADWISGVDFLPLNEHAPYLFELIAKQHFQTALKDLSDLTRLRDYLQQAEQRVDAMDFVLETQQQAWAQGLNDAQRESYQQSYQQLTAVYNELLEQQKLAEQEANGRRFVSQQELELWDIASHAEQLLAELSAAGQDVSDEQSQLALYQGILYWQASENDSQRRWEFKKDLTQVAKLLEEVKQRLTALNALNDNRYDAAYAGRIDVLRDRLQQQKAAVSAQFTSVEEDIRQLSIAELEQQQQRLSYYLGQAKLAVARLYDAGAKP